MTEKTNDTQIAQMRDAIGKIVAVGPDFLAKKIPAEKMAHTMVSAIEHYAEQAKKHGSLQPKTNEARELMEVLGELMGCGSGFLEQRCDAACVARTITYIVNEFPAETPVE